MKKNGNAREIILQSFEVPNKICNEEELFFRILGKVKYEKDILILEKNTMLSTDTYMNFFDVETWSKYTGLKKWKFTIEAQGYGKIRLYYSKSKRLIKEIELKTEKFVKQSVEFETTMAPEMIYFEVKSEDFLYIKKAVYMANVEKQYINDIHISLVICTYKREHEISQILHQFRESLFFDKKSDLYGKLSARIVDNNSALKIEECKYMKLYHNPNQGGSGGFTRGIVESRRDSEVYNISHMVFMDDDVQLMNETLYRLYAFLLVLHSDYHNRTIAGRMFRMDKKHIQYTASEIWNKGDIIHIAENQNMCIKDNLVTMNKGVGEYGGWWFDCFPMTFIKNNTPLPFFLHCDDVEYGLRHGGVPILLNGIQVWHETYEYRMSPTVRYYDVRNTLIVNTIYGYFENETDAWSWWKAKMDNCYCYEILIAMNDYLKGIKYFIQKNKKKRILKISMKLSRPFLPILVKILNIRFRKIGKPIFESYQEYFPRKK